MLRYALVAWVLAGMAVAQGVVLPTGTGTLQPSAEWTVLGKTELEQTERTSDPSDQVARSALRATVAELRDRQRTGHNVLLHRLGGATHQLELINCYAADARATSTELLSKAAVEQIRDAVIAATSTPGLTTVCSGFETSEIWAVPSLLLHFQHEQAQSPWRMDMQIVPSGDQLQYFECQFMADDNAAVQNIQDVLRTYNGAKEPDSRTTQVIILGLAGAVAGTLTALFRRNRQQRRAMAAGR